MQFALKTKESAKKIWQILLIEVQKGLFYKDLLDSTVFHDDKFKFMKKYLINVLWGYINQRYGKNIRMDL